ncbi:hypothetical protein BGZ83_004297, partial [Gryganskiella cystojenkinii]
QTGATVADKGAIFRVPEKWSSDVDGYRQALLSAQQATLIDGERRAVCDYDWLESILAHLSDVLMGKTPRDVGLPPSLLEEDGVTLIKSRTMTSVPYAVWRFLQEGFVVKIPALGRYVYDVGQPNQPQLRVEMDLPCLVLCMIVPIDRPSTMQTSTVSVYRHELIKDIVELAIGFFHQSPEVEVRLWMFPKECPVPLGEGVVVASSGIANRAQSFKFGKRSQFQAIRNIDGYMYLAIEPKVNG